MSKFCQAYQSNYQKYIRLNKGRFWLLSVHRKQRQLFELKLQIMSVWTYKITQEPIPMAIFPMTCVDDN